MTTHKHNPHAGAEQEYVLEDEETVVKAVAETKAGAVEPDRFSTGGATAEEIAEWRAAHAPKAPEPKAQPKKPDPEPEPAWRKSKGK